jgi:hypothetical protein
MALPQKVVEQLSRSSSTTPGWSSGLLKLAGTALVLGVFLYVGIIYGYKPYLEGEVTKLDAQIATFAQEVPVDEQAKIVGFYSQLGNLKSLLSQHAATSPLFDWLEKHTQANIYFTKLTLNVQTRQVGLTGVAKNVEDVSSQLAILQANENVARTNLSNVSILPSGVWQFDASIIFKEAFFKSTRVE